MSLIPFIMMKNNSGSVKKGKPQNSENQTYKGGDLFSSHYYKKDEVMESKRISMDSISHFDKLVVDLITHNPEILKVLAGTIDRYAQISKQDHKEAISDIRALCPESTKLTSEYLVLVSQLKEMGFELTCDKGKSFATVEEDERQEYGYTKKLIPLPNGINGCRFDREMFENGINPFSAAVDEFIAKNPDVYNEYGMAHKKYTTLASNKVLLTVSKKKREELQLLEEKVEKLKKLCDYQDQLYAYAEKYDAMSKEERAKLVECFDKMDEMNSMSEKITDLDERGLMIQGYINRYNRKQCREYEEYNRGVSARVIGEMSKEDTAKIAEFISQSGESIYSMSDRDVNKVVYSFHVYPIRIEVGEKYIPVKLIQIISERIKEKVMELEKESEMAE